MVIAVQDFDFMGGSLGMAAGEAVIKGLETAVEKGTPFIMFAASGGARMQEGILSLMQLPRTTVAVQMLREARKPYIVVLTNPTTGGVTASYAMLGDVQIAEPGALIGFAGPRVIEQTIREKLPDGFQRSEYLSAWHGGYGGPPPELRPTLANLCRLLTKATPKVPAETCRLRQRRVIAQTHCHPVAAADPVSCGGFDVPSASIVVGTSNAADKLQCPVRRRCVRKVERGTGTR